MSRRLERLDLTDFTGGLNLRAGQFQLADNESPDMLNLMADPRAGFYTRPGWLRWNATDVVAPASWDPRHAEMSPLSTGLYQVYVTNGGTVWAAGPDGLFTDLGVACSAAPHLADFAVWGDVTYMATGRGSASAKRDGTNAASVFGPLSFNDDYTVPIGGQFPVADLAEAHGGYMFVASTNEVDGEHPNRIRWSHPDSPEDWASLDLLDIEIGGGRITALVSYSDHLLILKSDAVFALYGYDLDSWQLIKVSRSVGAPSPTAVARSEAGLYFFSASSVNGVYFYDGEGIGEISLRIRPAMEEVTDFSNVWIGWVGRKVWCSVPCEAASTYVFDPDIGEGAWSLHRPALGSTRSIITRSDIDTEYGLGVLCGESGAACLVRLEADPRSATDQILESGDRTPFATRYVTGWKNMGWPERLKSWLRFRFVARRPLADVDLRLDVYKDYNTADPARSLTGTIPASGTVVWREFGYDDPLGSGFDFSELGEDDPSGRGANFSGGAQGALVGRVRSGFGPARAIQLQLRGAEESESYGLAWGIDGVFLKINTREKST